MPTHAHFSRRELVRASLASALGVSCSGWFPQLARAARQAKSPRSCILLWMNGGPSQTDTFDPKPNHENGGPVKAIPTSVPGIHISQFLPEIAKHMKDLALIRSMSSREGDHGRASQLMLTGYRPQPSTVFPSIGSLISKELGSLDNELPNYVSLSPRRFGHVAGPGFLGPEYGPLVISGDSDNPQARANLSIEDLAPPPGIDQRMTKRRFATLNFLQAEFNKKYSSQAAAAHQANVRRAARMIETQARNAFKLDEEKSELREAYGRNRFGQGCLLARRLIERGVPFVEVTLAQLRDAPAAWDTHANNFEGVEALCNVLDAAWSSLMTDLRDRGLLDSTLVIWMGEFGRTPNINDNNGRDHFPNAWSTVLGGAEIRGGQVLGDTGKDGMQAKDPVNVPSFYATICAALGIDYKQENQSSAGRPIALVDEGGEPIKQLLRTDQTTVL